MVLKAPTQYVLSYPFLPFQDTHGNRIMRRAAIAKICPWNQGVYLQIDVYDVGFTKSVNFNSQKFHNRIHSELIYDKDMQHSESSILAALQSGDVRGNYETDLFRSVIYRTFIFDGTNLKADSWIAQYFPHYFAWTVCVDSNLELFRTNDYKAKNTEYYHNSQNFDSMTELQSDSFVPNLL